MSVITVPEPVLFPFQFPFLAFWIFFWNGFGTDPFYFPLLPFQLLFLSVPVSVPVRSSFRSCPVRSSFRSCPFQFPFFVRSNFRSLSVPVSVPGSFLTRSYFCSFCIPASFWVWVPFGGRRLVCAWQSSYMDCSTGQDACGIAYAMWTWAEAITHPPTPGRVRHTVCPTSGGCKAASCSPQLPASHYIWQRLQRNVLWSPPP